MQANAQNYARAPQTPNEHIYSNPDNLLKPGIAGMQQTNTSSLISDSPNVKIASGGFSKF